MEQVLLWAAGIIFGVVIPGLVIAIWTFFWNKYRSYDEQFISVTSRLSDAEKDINMAHNKINVVSVSAATSDQLNKTVSDFRIEIATIFDKQDQRHTAAITRIEDGIRAMQSAVKEDFRLLYDLIKGKD